MYDHPDQPATRWRFAIPAGCALGLLSACLFASSAWRPSPASAAAEPADRPAAVARPAEPVEGPSRPPRVVAAALPAVSPPAVNPPTVNPPAVEVRPPQPPTRPTTTTPATRPT